MARNSDNTQHRAVKQPQSAYFSTLEADCCSSTSVVDWVGSNDMVIAPFHKQKSTKAPPSFTRPYPPKVDSFPEEYNDSGVALSSSKAPCDRETCQALYKKNLPQTCDEQLLIEKKLASLQISSGRPTDFSVPAEARRDSNSDDDVASEDLFNWDFIFQQDQDGDTQLHIAVVLDTQQDFALSVINLCIATQFLDLQNDLLQTVLHLAIIMRRTQVIQSLVSRGAALFICDVNGNTPLHLACQMGYTDAVHALTQKYRTQSEKHTLQRVIHHRNYEGMTCCHLSARSSAPDNLFHLIQDCGADINIQEGKRGMTVLHMAAESNNLIMVAFLVEYPSISLNQFTYDGWTALDLAKGRHLDDMETELRQAGAQCSEESDTSSYSSQSDEDIFSDEINDLEIF